MKIVCPFDRQIWYVHTQEQADRFQRHLQVHLPQQGDSMKAVDETPIVERYKVDWAMLSEPYVRPNTLNWAIERDKNMQRFAHTLIEELSASEQRERVLREALDAPITIADLKREGIQGLCAVSAIRAVNAIMLRRAALATPAPEQPTPKEPQI